MELISLLCIIYIYDQFVDIGLFNVSQQFGDLFWFLVFEHKLLTIIVNLFSLIKCFLLDFVRQCIEVSINDK